MILNIFSTLLTTKTDSKKSFKRFTKYKFYMQSFTFCLYNNGEFFLNETLQYTLIYYKSYGRTVTSLVDHINYSTQSTMSDKSFSYTSLFRKKKLYEFALYF